MVEKEVEAARYDLGRAEESLSREDIKWATVQGYYAFFHAVNSLVYRRGYREKSHRALLTVLEELYVREMRVPRSHLDAFRNAMNLREAADYGMTYSADGARTIVSDAMRFLEVVDTILGSPISGAS
jgi:uncharacterized protein (UPF0332 family)